MATLASVFWDSLSNIFLELLKTNDPEAALYCIEVHMEKFGGPHAECAEVYRMIQFAAEACNAYARGESGSVRLETAVFVLKGLKEDCGDEGKKVLRIALEDPGDRKIGDALFLERKCKNTSEFFDLLWLGRGMFGEKELRGFWLEYLKECGDGEAVSPITGPGVYRLVYPLIGSPYIDWFEENSRDLFLIDLAKKDRSILDYYLGENGLRRSRSLRLR